MRNPDFSLSLIEKLIGPVDKPQREKLKKSRDYDSHYGQKKYQAKTVDKSKYKF